MSKLLQEISAVQVAQETRNGGWSCIFYTGVLTTDIVLCATGESNML